jgi:hypothetical protein
LADLKLNRAGARELIEKEDLIKLSTGTYYTSNHSVKKNNIKLSRLKFIFQMSWYEARAFCQQLAMDLAKFESKSEMQLVFPKVKING